MDVNRKQELFICPVCADVFDDPVGHCMTCDHHYELKTCKCGTPMAFFAVPIQLSTNDIEKLMEWSKAHKRRRGMWRVYVSGSVIYEGGQQIR